MYLYPTNFFIFIYKYIDLQQILLFLTAFCLTMGFHLPYPGGNTFNGASKVLNPDKPPMAT